jgi:hypothetical protein
MEENQSPKEPSQFKQEWEEKKLLKRAQKKARKQLQAQGYTYKESTNLIKHALGRIASNKPAARAAGRGG